MAQRKHKGLGSSPSEHASRIAEIHAQIEQGLAERTRTPTAGITKRQGGCDVFLDGVMALEHRVGRAQGHLDGIAGSPEATTAMFKTQKRLASKVGSLSTKFRRSCMKGARR